MIESQDFDTIRPYSDHEVAGVLSSLINQPEFLQLLTQLYFKWLPKGLSQLTLPFFKRQLKQRIQGIDSINQFQVKLIKPALEKMIAKTVSHFSVSGLQQLSVDKSYLFISNHRDIVMDPALLNYALHLNGHNTARLGIGDNLLLLDFVSDLMRLNKSFVIHRNPENWKHLVTTLRRISNYIRYSLKQDESSVWIAQRDGRAKDGRDLTDPAVIKMLTMRDSGSKASFAERMGELSVVPVAISYEYDPCDVRKARELCFTERYGSYTKEPGEDMESIVEGIMGQKGRVHVGFAAPLEGEFATAAEVAHTIDKSIAKNYVLTPSHLIAWHERDGKPCSDSISKELEVKVSPSEWTLAKKHFRRRIGKVPATYRPYLLDIYANVLDTIKALSVDDGLAVT